MNYLQMAPIDFFSQVRYTDTSFGNTEVTTLNTMLELGRILLLCLVGEWIAGVLPFAFPSSVISMILLMLLLMTGVVKEHHVQTVCRFFLVNMGLFFIPSIVNTMQYADLLRAQLVPFLLVTVLTTPIVYLATAWSVQALTRFLQRKGDKHHD